MFDVDGVVLQPRKEFFSLKFAREQGIPKEAVEEFFLGDFKKCPLGQGDLKELITPYLPKWKWDKGVDAFLKYWFDSENEKNEEVLKLVADLRSKGIKCYLATQQEKYRLQYLLDTIGLKNYFDGAFSTCEVGCEKKQPEFHMFVLKKLGLNPSEILYFDDNEKNIQTARQLGIEAYIYENLETLKQQTNQGSYPS